MPDIIHLTNFLGEDTLTTDENYFLAEGVTHYATGGGEAIEISGDGSNDIFIAGSLVMLGDTSAIGGTSETDEAISITVVASGSILGASDYRAIFLDADRIVVNNAGYITGGEAIRLTGDGNQIVNSGSIESIFNNSTSVIYTIEMDGTGAQINNSGTISGRYAIDSNNSDLSFTNTGAVTATETALRIANITATVSYVTNHGTLTSTRGLAIDSDDGVEELTNTGTISGDIDMDGGADLIQNTGTIIGNVDIGLSETGEDVILNSGNIIGNVLMSIDDNLLRNSGEIIGDVDLGSGADTLRNSGEIDGDVMAGDQSDVIINSGEITGIVTLGSGDDIFETRGTGVNGDLIDGGLGEDTITGGNGVDFIDGGDDNDRLFGRGGDDDLRGGLGSDFMSAGAGDDFVLGDNGADRMFGGGGEDTLQGGRDLDTIRGGDGDDEINGGRSADVLRGGAGADTFLYQFRQDSTLNLSDTIQDFEVGVDVIDVSGIAGQFAFVGSAAFSGTGNEVRYEIGGNGKTFVEVDTDANGTADMRILLTAVGVLTEDDFVL